MGACLITSIADAHVGDLAHRHPLPPWPKMPRPTYRDPAKARTVEDVRVELGKVAAKAQSIDPKTARQVQAATGRAICPGWRMTPISDGCFAVGERGELFGAEKDRPALAQNVIPLGALPALAWRDYAPVRPLANERSKAIRWEFSEDRVRFSTNGQPDLGSAVSWHLGKFQPDTKITLSDGYLWPCRGLAWNVAICDGPAILLTSGDLQVLVMGMRD